MQAMIVADAYKQTMLADWVSPLYRRVVLAGDMHYLSEFKAVFTLTPIIMQELASRSAPSSFSSSKCLYFPLCSRSIMFSLFLLLTYSASCILGRKRSMVFHSSDKNVHYIYYLCISC